MKRICLYGASSASLAQEYYAAAHIVGQGLAACGIGLVFGGGATGLMGAAARGSDSKGGEIIGVAPSFFDQEGVLYQNCTEFIFTDTMRERKQIMEDLADGFIVTPGGIGTLEEFFEIFTLRQLHRHEKPIYILNTCGYYNRLLAFLEHMVEEGFMKQDCLDIIHVYSDPETLIAALQEA
ncbi:MAG: TIGR00730 family Rossman fold protein [Firmicutes bacterium]|nr:TIGR00730 family Rossman fold protein [Bacillota bacterium]